MSPSLFSFVSRKEEEAGAELSMITMSDAGVSSPPVDSEEGGASGLSMGACTAGWESGSGEDRGRPSSSIVVYGHRTEAEASLAVSRVAVARRAAASLNQS